MNLAYYSAVLLSCLAGLGSCKSENYTRNGYTLQFEDKSFGFSADTHNRMVKTFFVVYPKEVNTYNRAAPKRVVFFIDPSYHGVAATSGNLVRFDPSYFAKHPKDIDVVTHETMHIVQAYKGRVLLWAVEGIADYVRYTMGVDNKGAGWSLPAFKPSQRYTNGYAVTARFFVWLEKKVKPGLVKAYDKALRGGKYADFFKRFTGKTVDQLWQQYAKNPFRKRLRSRAVGLCGRSAFPTIDMPPKLIKCACAAEPSDSQESIQCEQCKRWFQEVCIGIPAAELGRINAYYCLLCISKQPSLRITYSTEATKPSTDALLDKVLARFDSLVSRLDGFCEALTKLSTRMDEFEQKGARAVGNRYGQPPSDTQVPVNIAAIAAQVLAEQQSAEKKRLSAVIERLPEQSAAEDIAVVTEIAERCGVKDELDAERIHRHGREQPERGRIIKVPFSTSHARDKFLQNFISVKKNFYSTRFPSITVRRDLTPLELQTHHTLKKQAWDMNLECKLYKFHYTNLRIVTLPYPKPLRTRDRMPPPIVTC